MSTPATIFRAASEPATDVSRANHELTAVISTSSVDRRGLVALTEGIDHSAYVANPVVLFEYGKDPTRGSLPIGRALWVRRDGSRLTARIRFADDPFARALFGMYDEGLMSAWGISALSTEPTGPPTSADLRKNPGWAKASAVVRSSELLSVSAVAVPENPDCLTVEEREQARTIIARAFRAAEQDRPEKLPPLKNSRTLAEVEADCRKAVDAWRADLAKAIKQAARPSRS